MHPSRRTLDQGVLSGDRVVCPWHNACFNVATGARLEPPALESLPKFATSIEDGMVWVELPDSVPTQQTPEMTAPAPEVD
ncbi:MAG: Rieske 2Fe-2S domain-containing protein, partial [Leptolyngbyaceae cyanobacterium SM1_1_3]|nr:Rieske 2Fe-2S domain-containing protein [Leptolyngbyaceae cyanobacterium SM1_1_3]